MRIFLFTLLALVLTACSKPYDKYIGYWKAEGTKSPRVLEIYKEGKDTYLVNDNILSEKDWFGNKKNGTVLEQTDKELGVNNGLTVVKFNVSEDGKTLRISNKQYTKISEDEVQTIVKNKQACDDLRTKYLEEAKTFNIFAKTDEKTKQEQIKESYLAKQKEISDCNFYISKAY